jgi:putative hydroxymethylpyrimidine transport system ATP-binding protein
MRMLATNSESSSLYMERICFSFDHQPIVDDLTFSLQPHEFVALVGRSGIGKSTLLKLCAGLLQPSSGSMKHQGKQVNQHDLLGNVVYMPQRDGLFPWRTAIENVAISLELKGVNHREACAQAYQLLERFELADCANQYPWQLSGGMRQRIAFLRTMMSKASVFLLDEPFSALDGLSRQKAREWLLTTWQTDKPTMLMITHDIEEAILLADRIFIWNQSPCSKLEEVIVPFARPRTNELMYDSSFVDLRRHIIGTIEVSQ